jgi:prepilin-type processing-associated H-X9-DG protein
LREIVYARAGSKKSAGATDSAVIHPGGANFLFADGGVRFVKELIGFTIFQSLATEAGCEVVSADQS